MKRSIVLVAIAAALGLSACTSTPTPAPDTTATSSSAPSSATPPAAVVTEVVTQTVTNLPPPPAKPVIGSFGSGATEEKLKVEYTNLKPSIGSSYTATADGNSNAYFHFLVDKDMVTTAVLNINGQDCHS